MLALVAATLLSTVKLGVGWWSGSVGVTSDGIHSFLDLISAAVAFFTVREAGKPADDEHPFGHGKIETLSSFFEAVLLGAAAVMIIYHGLERLANPKPLAHEWEAIGVIFASTLVSLGVFLHNRKVAIETESPAIRVNAWHFFSDVLTSVGILAGLILLKITGWLFIDPILALGVGVYVMVITYGQVKETLAELVDVQLPRHEIESIKYVLDEHSDDMLEYHDLRTRKSGAARHIDLHMVSCSKVTVHDSHEVCDRIEADIHRIYPHAEVTIHVEPCTTEGIDCSQQCAWEKKKAK